MARQWGLLILGLFLMGVGIGAEAAPPAGLELREVSWTRRDRSIARQMQVMGSDIYRELQGHAERTRGGLRGYLYTVTKNTDYQAGDGTPDADKVGTLRYGIEEFTKCPRGEADPLCPSGARTRPVWIVFDLPASSQRIVLKKGLDLPSRLTLDGRGFVSPGQPNRIELNSPFGEIMVRIMNVQDVIVSDLKFTHHGTFDIWMNITGSRAGAGFVIGRGADLVWLNHLDISNCGDTCINLGRSYEAAIPHRLLRITVSHTRLWGHTKTVLFKDCLQQEDDPRCVGRGRILASFYGNWFDGTSQRNAKLVGSGATIHFFNNFVDYLPTILDPDQGGCLDTIVDPTGARRGNFSAAYGVLAIGDASAVVHDNVFNSSSDGLAFKVNFGLEDTVERRKGACPFTRPSPAVGPDLHGNPDAPGGGRVREFANIGLTGRERFASSRKRPYVPRYQVQVQSFARAEGAESFVACIKETAGVGAKRSHESSCARARRAMTPSLEIQ